MVLPMCNLNFHVCMACSVESPTPRGSPWISSMIFFTSSIAWNNHGIHGMAEKDPIKSRNPWQRKNEIPFAHCVNPKIKRPPIFYQPGLNLFIRGWHCPPGSSYPLAIKSSNVKSDVWLNLPCKCQSSSMIFPFRCPSINLV